MTRPFFYRQTGDVRVTVRPAHLRDESHPDLGQWVFAYAVRIENVGRDTVQLRSRRWLIQDSAGESTVVEGDGVVGLQPHIGPGRVHEYQSFCVLASPAGHMEGEYRFERPDGSVFAAAIPRFELGIAE